MLLPNNPDLDYDKINKKLQMNADQRLPEMISPPPSTQINALFSFSETSANPEGQDDAVFVDYVQPQPSNTQPSGQQEMQNLNITARLKRRFLLMTKPGISIRQRIRYLPMVGDVLFWMSGILRFNRVRMHIAAELEQLKSMQLHFAIQQKEFQQRHADTERRLNNLLAKLQQADVDKLHMHSQIDGRMSRIDDALRRSQASIRILDGRVAALTQQTDIRLSASEISLEVIPETAATSPIQRQTSTNTLDNFYTEFEQVFRGSNDDIKDRLRVYLPYLQAQKSSAGRHLQVVDIGCGRGEWLELLSENGFSAIGVDTNTEMVKLCRDRGMQAECENAIAYLNRQTKGSLLAVTGFHIIEHIPFEQLIELIDAALHAIADHGVLIFETPNPENLAVGSCTFYNDPTHLHPIVPAVAEFMLRQRGFAKAEILRLHPFPEHLHVSDHSELARRFNAVMYGPQDFAVIGWKQYVA